MDSYREYLHSMGLASRSIGEYEREVNRSSEWLAVHGHDLLTAPPSLIAAYVDTRPRSWSTRKMVRSALKHYWAMAGRPAPPVGAIRVPPKPRGRCRAFDEDDTAILAKAARTRGDDPGLAVALALYAGLRRNEIATLRWECFDTAMEWVTIQGKFDAVGTIPVHPRLRALLTEKGRGSGWVFPGRFPDQPSTGARIWHWFRRVAEDAGVPDVAPHRARHTVLASMLDATGDLKTTAAFARHVDSRSIDTYTRTSAIRLRAAVAAVDY
jgi:integrase